MIGCDAVKALGARALGAFALGAPKREPGRPARERTRGRRGTVQTLPVVVPRTPVSGANLHPPLGARAGNRNPF